MRLKNANSRSKGSVLVVVIGILAILAIMALRFNAEMETAMIKTSGRNLSSDVKVLASSGLIYCIGELLKSGKNCPNDKTKPKYSDHAQLAIEEELELRLKSSDYSAPPEDKIDRIGTGVPFFGAEHFNANFFYNGQNSISSLSYIPENLSLAPGNINFMVEDLSGKIPIGHISQYFQRLLVSALLSKLLTNKVPIILGADRFQNYFASAELFEDVNFEENGYDKEGDRYVFLRSLIPFEVAKKSGLPKAHLNVAGLPLADGIIALEELGSSYTWVKGSNKESEKKHATDYPRSINDYKLLSSALTPFSRFSHETRFSDLSTNPSRASPVSYASINPMVMYRQNERLYNALFNFEPVDPKLRMYFSVSFDPEVKSDGMFATDDIDGLVPASVNISYFEKRVDGFMLSSAMTTTVLATSSNLVYNARDDEEDLHLAPPLPFDSIDIVLEKKRFWGDAEFLMPPSTFSAYYVAMDKAIKRMSRAFKGTMIHEYPAENMMCPIMSRKSLEFAIIQAVFGNSILFVSGNKLITGDKTVDYLKLFNAIHNGEINLKNIKFVENAFSKFDDPIMSANYFVPYWQHYDEHLKSDDKYTPPNEFGLNIKVPSFGLYLDGGEYLNYLPHPQTDQRRLDKVFVSVAAAYSVEMEAEVNPTQTGEKLDIRSLYLDETVEGVAARNETDKGDA